MVFSYFCTMQTEKIILGIDPGTTVMGFGIISVKGSKMELVSIHELVLKKYPNHETKLKYIFERTLALIDEFHPDGAGSSFLWEKCAEYAQTRQGAGRCDGGEPLPRYSHYRIFPQKSKNGDYRKRKRKQRAGCRHAEKPARLERISHQILRCLRRAGGGGVPLFQFGKGGEHKILFELGQLPQTKSGQAEMTEVLHRRF